MEAVIELGPGVYAGITDREGGVSAAPYDTLNLGLRLGDDAEAVGENRRRAAVRWGLDPTRIAWMSQVHGSDIAVVTEPGDAGRVDGAVTTRSELALTVLVADCLPVLVADPTAGVLGAAHSGRPGTARGVATALLAEMVRHGARPSECVALLGPAVCGECYEVPQDVADEVTKATPEARCRTRRGTPGVDLRSAVTAQLDRAGVGTVRSDDRCTMESAELFSYRRDGVTGRFAGYLWRV